MPENKREYPLFALCGLNCGLCPRYQTEGASRCPGCGGPDFHLKHPTCPVVTCNKKHDNVEFCFQCSAYPCRKYAEPSTVDSFISYLNVLVDFAKAQADLDKYKAEIREKVGFLEFLLQNYNDGRRKSFYCTAVNNLDVNSLRQIRERIEQSIKSQATDLKNKIQTIVDLFEGKARLEGVELKLRK
ncbi:MAG: DUF3795 domain-containing protein [Candidatus Neomarinimicrobiota bacterium]